MHLSSLECYATAKLNCGVADLCMLDNVYSVLGEDCFDTDELVENSSDLNELLAEAYFSISSRVQDIIMDWVEDKEPIELVINDKFVTIDFTEQQVEKITALAETLTENYPFANCLDTYFQNELDQTVDWESNAESNAEYLLKYWVENEEIELEEEKEVMAYCISSDGEDEDHETLYILRGKKLYWDDELICDMTDDEEIDTNLMAQKICDRECDLVKSIVLEDKVIYENTEE